LHLVKIGSSPLHASIHSIINGAEPILTKCNEAETERGGAYLIFSVLKRVKGRGLFYLSAMKQKQQRGGVYLIFSVVKHVKGRSLFNI
jgi:hypothetical protein